MGGGGEGEGDGDGDLCDAEGVRVGPVLHTGVKVQGVAESGAL